MAMAWIERVVNRSSVNLELTQTDPTWHPVSGGRQYASGERIVVAPGQTMDFQYFVVPWEGYGNLVVSGPGGVSTWNVGPRRDNQDYLYGVPQSGGTATEILLGIRGNQFEAPSRRYQLSADGHGVRFEELGRGLESVIFNPIVAAFKQLFGIR